MHAAQILTKEEKKIYLLNTGQSSLLLWFKNRHWGAWSLWLPFSKAILIGTISIIYNWTFYKEIAVVYLLSFCPIRTILLPWKLLWFPIIWHCCSFSLLKGPMPDHIKLVSLPAIHMPKLWWTVNPPQCIIYSLIAFCNVNKRNTLQVIKLQKLI